jgi:ABC-2 type transport system ATP-binding protein
MLNTLTVKNLNKTLEIAIRHDQPINQLFEVLTNHNIQVLSFRNKTNRLEKMFLKLTK